MSCQPSVISKIVEVSEGDLRKAITFLQSVSRLKGAEEVTEGDIMEIAGVSVLLHSLYFSYMYVQDFCTKF